MVRVGLLLPALFSLVIFLSVSRLVSAITAPTLLSPTNQSTISSGPTLTWEVVEGAIQYRIIIDDESSTTSPYIRNYYTTNARYSPQLDPGIYYWKVAAKDSGGTWSDWSPIWSFTLSVTSSPPPSAPEETSPTPSPPSPPLTSPQPSSSLTPRSSFTVTNIPSQINSDQSFTVSAELTLPNNPNSTFYLKGAFRKIDSTNYFGLTKVGSSWIKNGTSYSSQYQITTDPTGSWSGSLEVKVDSADSGFIGSGDYIFRVGRYSSSGSGPTWSNDNTITIVATEEQTKTTTSLNQSSKTSPSVMDVSKTKGVSKIQASSLVPQKSNSPATISATTSVPVEVKGQKYQFILPALGAILIILGFSSLAFIYFKEKYKKHEQEVYHNLS